MGMSARGAVGTLRSVTAGMRGVRLCVHPSAPNHVGGWCILQAPQQTSSRCLMGDQNARLPSVRASSTKPKESSETDGASGNDVERGEGATGATTTDLVTTEASTADASTQFSEVVPPKEEGSTPPASKEPGLFSQFLRLHWLFGPSTRENFRRYFWIITGSGVATFFIYSFWKGGKWMSSFTLMGMAKVGFFSGMICSGLIMLTILAIRGQIIIHKEKVYAKVLRQISKDPRVKAVLGQRIRPSNFTAYHMKGGLFSKLHSLQNPSNIGLSSLTSPHRRQLELLFQVEGRPDPNSPSTQLSSEEGDPQKEEVTPRAMVSVHVIKRRSLLPIQSLEYKSIAVDCMNTGERILIEGDDEDVIYKGVIHLR